MKVFIGLGNPSDRYAGNRHNVGFMLVEWIAEQFQNAEYKVKDLSEKIWKFDKYLNAELVTINTDLIFIKPQTYMNKSGDAVKKMVERMKLETRNLLVAHDDLDIPLGKFKIQQGTGPLLHNGIESIEHALGTKDFMRVRIGVDARGENRRIPGETYVLQDFLQNEKEQLLTTVFPLLYKQCKTSRLL